MIGGIDSRVVAIAAIIMVAVLGIIIFMPMGNPPGVTDENRAKFACELLCKGALQQGRDLSNGPCLSTEIGDVWELSDWVCDIAHDPREPEDNQPGNQCPDFGVTATHFVEFTPDCRFIRLV
jgi:hypothetical protein